MARPPAFPTANLRRSTSGALTTGAPTADAASFATRALGQAAERFGAGLRRMADETYVREGQADAARAIEASRESGSEVAIRQGSGIDDRAFNEIARQYRSAQRRAAYLDEVGKVELASDGDLERFGLGAAAVREAFRPTGDAQLDADFATFATLQDAQALGRTRERAERRRIDTGRAAFQQSVAVETTALGQAITTAPFDADGARLVGAHLGRLANQLAVYGPREAFSVGGVEFAADPNRMNVMDAADLARVFDQTQREARASWILSASDRIEGSTAKLSFLGRVQERWEAGDPMFAGLDAGDFTRLRDQLRTDVSRAATDENAAMRGAGERARELLRAMEFGGEVDGGELRQLAAASGDFGLAAEVDFRLTYGPGVTPDSLRGGGPGGAGVFGDAVDFVLDRLEGPGFVAQDNGAGRAQWGITERSHPEAWRDGRIDRAEAAAIYRRDYWDAIGGDSLPPDLAVAAFAAAVVGGVGTARELLRQSGGSADRFLELERARFERLARENPARYGDDLRGWQARHGRVRAQISAVRAQARAREGFAGDPIGFARGNGRRGALATVTEFDPGAVFEGGAAAAGWAEAIRSRLATGAQLSDSYGVPRRVLDDAEAAFYRDRFSQDPQAIVTFARTAGQALGGEGARQLLTELGRAGVAGADLQLATLSMTPASANVVAKIVQGRALKADGARTPELQGETMDEAFQRMAPAFAASPAVLAGARALAEDMAIADAGTGQLRRDASFYLNSALGAVERGGVRFGGVTRVNGAETVAPSWLAADRLDEALEIAARGWVSAEVGPVDSAGRPMAAAWLSRMRLRAMPNGRYRLVNPETGRDLAARSGRAFEFDIEREAFVDVLAERLPGAVVRSR